MPADTNFRKMLQTSVAVVLLFGAVGCGGGDISVFVDNGGRKPMVVKIDGKEAATIQHGKHAKLEIAPGERKLQVDAGDSTIFSGTKEVKKSDKFLVSRRYLFNPDYGNRYLTYTVKYGSSPLGEMFKAALVGNPTDKEGKLRLAYQEMLAMFKLMPATSWFEVPDGVMVLQPPPESVRSKSRVATRTVLARVEEKDYDFLEAARKVSNPTERDVEKLADVLEKVFDEAP